jgi:hypothetical protein
VNECELPIREYSDEQDDDHVKPVVDEASIRAYLCASNRSDNRQIRSVIPG